MTRYTLPGNRLVYAGPTSGKTTLARWFETGKTMGLNELAGDTDFAFEKVHPDWFGKKLWRVPDHERDEAFRAMAAGNHYTIGAVAGYSVARFGLPVVFTNLHDSSFRAGYRDGLSAPMTTKLKLSLESGEMMDVDVSVMTKPGPKERTGPRLTARWEVAVYKHPLRYGQTPALTVFKDKLSDEPAPLIEVGAFVGDAKELHKRSVARGGTPIPEDLAAKWVTSVRGGKSSNDVKRIILLKEGEYLADVFDWRHILTKWGG